MSCGGLRPGRMKIKKPWSSTRANSRPRRTGVYRLTDEERASIREGLEQARRGEFVSDAEMDAFWKSSGAV